MNGLRNFTGEPKIPFWFKLWFGFCAVVGLATTGVVIWAIVKLVNHFCGEGA